MAKFCTACGAQADDNATVCPVCGAPFAAPAQPAAPQPAPQEQNAQVAPAQPTVDPNQQANPNAQTNPNVAAKPDTLMCILSYLGILALIPFLSKKDDDFIMFHAKQGLNLTIVCWIASFGLGFVSGLSGIVAVGYLGDLISIFELVLSIMGIVAATKGERKVLPLMDKIKIIK